MAQTVMRNEDNRPQANALRRLQSLSENAPQMSQLQTLQAKAANASSLTKWHSTEFVAQRFRGATGTAEAAAEVPMTLNNAFVKNHVAEDAQEAINKTNQRILDVNEPAAMKTGSLANSLAPLATWETAINGSEVVLPPQDDWGGEYGFDDTTTYNHKLTGFTVKGWEAKGKANAVIATEKEISKYVGGEWKVAGGTTTNGSNVNTSADATHVTVDIDHCTG
ncbi:hypothetical protein S2091_3392 [Solimicrobium silvestre]|uniref:Uncharacterized protein n=2 Tax=Solimicrobium silvestre TaxID=2099400 RepID=A0A2S9GW01_9BURK|nr:hypothetical protein S2091_3392 [Solimicrobium silvestre]